MNCVIIEAQMFWWLYRSPYRVENPSKPWPIILWLQGGPVSSHDLKNLTWCQFFFLWNEVSYHWIEQGGSGTGYGNFKEIGPLDVNLKPRNFTWLKKADLLFVVTMLCALKLWWLWQNYSSNIILLNLKKCSFLGSAVFTKITVAHSNSLKVTFNSNMHRSVHFITLFCFFLFLFFWRCDSHHSY